MNTPLETALEEMRNLHPEVWLDTGGSLSCHEVNTLTRLFLALGLTDHAHACYTGHCAHEDGHNLEDDGVEQGFPHNAPDINQALNITPGKEIEL